MLDKGLNVHISGIDVAERVPGPPSARCGDPTRVIQREVLRCSACGHRQERAAATRATADPGQCEESNP